MLEITLTDAKSLLINGEFPKSLQVGNEVVDVVSYDLETNVVVVQAPANVVAWNKIIDAMLYNPLGVFVEWAKKVFGL